MSSAEVYCENDEGYTDDGFSWDQWTPIRITGWGGGTAHFYVQRYASLIPREFEFAF